MPIKKNFLQIFTDRIKKDGLDGFWQYLEKNGGLGIYRNNYTEEYSALDALKARKGECTEVSKILFSILRAADFQPLFIHDDLRKEKGKDLLVRQAIEELPNGMMHVCVGLEINGKLRLLDPSLVNADANYKHYLTLSPRQYLSMDYSNRGNVWEGKSKWDVAIADYTKAVEIDPELAEAYSNRGIAWHNKDELDKAIADYTKAVEIDPKLARAFTNRGLVWHKKGNLNRAIVGYTKAIEIDPKLAEAYSNRGNVWVDMNELDRAINDYTKAVEIDRRFANAYYGRSNVWAGRGEWDKTIIDATKTLEINPEYAGAYSIRGFAWQNKGELDKAMIDHTKAIDIDPKLSEAYANRAIIRVQRNEFKGATDDLASYFRLTGISFQGFTSELIKNFEPFWEKGGNEKIARAFDNDINSNIAEVEARLILAYSLWQNGAKNDAVEQFKAVVEIELTIKDNPAKSTKEFLWKILQAMPKTMEMDNRVSGVLGPILAKIK